MQHPDEGTIHAWLDGELSPSEAEQIETHTRECAECAQKVAEARGLIAASTRILTALDNVPSGVVASSSPSQPRVRRWYDRTDFRAAAVFLFFAGASLVALRVGRMTKSPLQQTMAKVKSAPVAALAVPDTGASVTAETPQNSSQPKREARRLAASPPAVSANKAPSTANAFGLVRAMDEVASSKPAEAPPVAQSAAEPRALMRMKASDAAALAGKVGGAVRSDVAAGRVEGKVVDSAGRPVAGAQLIVAGTRLGTATDKDGKFTIDSIPAGQRQLQARRIGYVAQTVPVDVKEQSAVATNITMTPMTARLEAVVVTGVAQTTRARALGAAITMLKKDTSGTTRREVYEVSPGVNVTLVDSLIDIPAEKDLKTRMQASSAPAPAAPPRAMSASTSPINTISWRDGNHVYTLSGPLTTKELEAIKPRVMKMRR